LILGIVLGIESVVIKIKEEYRLGYWALWKLVVFALFIYYFFFTNQEVENMRWLNYALLAYLCSLEHLLLKISETQK
jgi:hypothetical protein